MIDPSLLRFAALAALSFLAACGGPAVEARDGGHMADSGPPPRSTEAVIPAATGECPAAFTEGTLTFAPAGIAPRDVRIWMSDAAAELDGPLVFYWHGTGASPDTAVAAIGQENLDAILAMGGIVAAPFHDPEAGDFPWFLTLGSRSDDLLVADEVLACAASMVGVDPAHIHSLGHSAGALHTAQMSFRRASYLASVVTYSGGLLSAQPPRSDDPNNLFPALIFHGGTNDVVEISFEDASERYWNALHERGHYAAICNTGLGHAIDPDAPASAWRFLSDHPFGAVSPYESGLPEGFYPSCANEP